MDKYKNFVVIEEIKALSKQGKSEEALELALSVDPRKIRDNYDCIILGEVFLSNGMLGRARECYTLVYDRKKSRRVAMELVNICIRLKKAEDAEKYFEDYKRMAPNDYYNYIFKYKIDRLKGCPLKEQAVTLEKLKKAEFMESWGYELAKIYHKMGEGDACLRTCEDIIIWFGEGEIVDKAKALKAYYLGEISLKDLTAPKPETADESKTEELKGEQEVKDEEVKENGVTEEENKEAQEIKEEKEQQVSENIVYGVENIENGEISIAAEEENIAEYQNGENGEEFKNSQTPEPVVKEAEEPKEYDGASAMKNIGKPGASADYTKEKFIEEEYTEEEYTEEDYTEEEYTEEDYTEEEYTEEDLSDVEADTIKVLADGNRFYKDIKTEPHEVDLATEALARQVEAVLLEENTEKDTRKEEIKPEDATRVWVKEDTEEIVAKTEKNTTEAEHEVIAEPTGSSPLLEAVERELGFVDGGTYETAGQKKGWISRFKEKHFDKDRKKHEEVQKESAESRKTEMNEPGAKNKEVMSTEEAAELEKQRFIERERKKDRKKFLEHQRQIAKLISEKAGESALKTEKTGKAEKSENAEEDRRVLIESTDGMNIYKPRKLECAKAHENGFVAACLSRTGKTLEDYFGFFACQKDMGEQIINCLEQLLDKDGDTMNYCIIGERGNGKKALAHGVARFMAESGKLASSQTVWADASKVNEIDISEKTDKLRGRCLVINQAGALETEAIEDISKVVERLHKKTMIVITDYRRNIADLFRNREGFEELFRSKITITNFNQDDLFDYVDYKVGKAGFVFEEEAYDLMAKRIKGIMRATEEGALARVEKYVIRTLDNAEQRNGEEYIRQTLENERHIRSNVIISADLPAGI